MNLPSKDRELVFEISDNGDMFRLFGSYDENLAILEDGLDVKIVARGRNLVVYGDEEELGLARTVLDNLLGRARLGQKITTQDVRYVIRSAKEGNQIAELGDNILVNHRGKPIGPRTQGQKEYIEAIRDTPLVFGIGRRARARHTWQWRWRWRPSRRRKSTG